MKICLQALKRLLIVGISVLEELILSTGGRCNIPEENIAPVCTESGFANVPRIEMYTNNIYISKVFGVSQMHIHYSERFLWGCH